MASATERLLILIETKVDGAKAGLKGFGDSVKEADGFMGKFKAGGAAALESVKANAGLLAVSGGTALVSFGIKALEAFEATAKGARDFGAATGTGVENASRLIAVADDFGVSAESLQGAVGKIGKSLDATKWQEYGIATRDAGGNARDVTDIYLDTLDMLGKIDNETERARVGTELFGKAYAGIAPEIGKTREEYEAMLGAVEKGQVITAAEAAKAEKMRIAQDALSDALNEVTLAVGGAVASMGPFLQNVAEGVSRLTALAEKLGLVENGLRIANAATTGGLSEIPSIMDAATDRVDMAGLSLDKLAKVIRENGLNAEQARPVIEAWAKVHTESVASVDALTDAILGTTTAAAEASPEFHGLARAEQDAADAAAEASPEFHGLARAEDTTRRSTEQLDAKMKAMLGTLSADEALIVFRQEMQRLAEDAFGAAAGSDEQALAIIRMKQTMIEYVGTLAGVPASKRTEILTLIDQGKLQEAQAAINSIPALKTVTINAKLTGSASAIAALLNGSSNKSINAGAAANARGTEDFAGGWTWAGENGPELVNLPSGSRVRTATESESMVRNGAGGGNGVTINISTGNVYGERHLQDMFNSWSRDIAAQIKAGRR